MADGGEGTPPYVNDRNVILSCDSIGQSNTDLMSRHILDRSSYTLGQEILTAINADKKARFYIGIGGTMTCDGGAGMLQALGAKFYENGKEIDHPITPRLLTRVDKIDLSGLPMKLMKQKLHLLADTFATLLPPGLSALDFCRQKGADAEDIEIIKDGLENLLRLTNPKPLSEIDGAGGGIGFALASVIGLPYSLGAETIIKSKKYKWNEIDLIITGEGSIDNQTKGGKVVEVMRRVAEKRGIAFAAIGGYVEPQLRAKNIISTIDTPNQFNKSLANQRLFDAAKRLYMNYINNFT